MSKYKGSLEDIIDVDAKSDPKLDSFFQQYNSEYWIHRTSMSTSLYFNTFFKSNGLPLILTYEEALQYREKGKKVTELISVEEFYEDEKQRQKILRILGERGLTGEDFEKQLREKLKSVFSSFFELGLYIPDFYGGDLKRTAHQYSPEIMRETIQKENFGFNNYRGEWNAAIILQIPPEELDSILIPLPETTEHGTGYLGIAEISEAVSPKYIKGLIVKLAGQTFYIVNDGFGKNKDAINEESSTIESEEKVEENNSQRVEENQQPKRVLRADRVMQLLTADAEHLRKTLISFGFPYASTRGLSEQVLRDMIFDRAIPEDSAIIDILCSQDSSLKKTVLAMGERMADVGGKTRDEVERMFIERVGLDNVINASYEIQRQDEERGIQRNYFYENTLESMRHERALNILNSDEYRSLSTPEERKAYISSLPPRLQEDVVRAASTNKNFADSTKEIISIL